MIAGQRAFGYLRINGPDDQRLGSLQRQLLTFCRSAQLRLVSVFHDFDPEQTDAAWLGYAQLLNALHQRPHSALVIPDISHLGTDKTALATAIMCLTVAKARLRVTRHPDGSMASSSSSYQEVSLICGADRSLVGATGQARSLCANPSAER
jgi:hypothetical protein